VIFETASMRATYSSSVIRDIPRGPEVPPVMERNHPSRVSVWFLVEREGKRPVYVYRVSRAGKRLIPDWFKLALVNSALSGRARPGGNSTGIERSRLYKSAG